MTSRRQFLGTAAAATVSATTSAASGNVAVTGEEAASATPHATESIDLCGPWQFALDRDDAGQRQRWFASGQLGAAARAVQVPHTWQIEAGCTEYFGIGWYGRSFEASPHWLSSVVRVQFEAVFHTATVWVNGQLAGEHTRKGYTAFTLDISQLIRYPALNRIIVRVDNAFDERMFPRGRSSDWAPDGGIYRPVQLLVAPRVYIAQLDVDARPGDDAAALTGVAHLENTSSHSWSGTLAYRVIDPTSGLSVAGTHGTVPVEVLARRGLERRVDIHLPRPELWHFDHPHLYRLDCWISGSGIAHSVSELFGVRRLEVRGDALVLNGESVRLVGVERMAGSHPDLGMAETSAWIAHDHEDLRNLNCVLTRTHWPQDRRVLDYCDRNGILVQCEVPVWGWESFAGMGAEPESALLQNGLEQLREMIARDRNHPSIVIWGLCNEIAGQRPADKQFVMRMAQEARRLDPNRLLSYASNSLGTSPQRDAAGLLDIIETNEYFGTWQAGGTPELDQHLEALHAAFPDKPIIVSEYGYCACTPERPEGDERRIQILESHNAVIRAKKFVAGAIFFCYNDYRTHVGERGVGALRQRVHGVVDVYGVRKPSYEVLRAESSPVERLSVYRHESSFTLTLRTRDDVPRCTLRGYRLRAVAYGPGGIADEQQEFALPEMPPGSEVATSLRWASNSAPLRARFEVLRPDRRSVFTMEWNSQ